MNGTSRPLSMQLDAADVRSDARSPHPELLDPLRRVLDWLIDQRDPETGALVCPFHRIEHTGKTACAVILAVEVARWSDGRERTKLVEFAHEQCTRIAGRLEREGDSTCFTFRPGRHDPYNCSNSVIDGGACSDALATFVLAFGGGLTQAERDAFTRASVLHAQTYLRYAIVDKGVPAQCAWAMTGAAQAFRLSDHEVLRYACEVGTDRIFDLQNSDGSVPYHPIELGAEHAGASDASAYYQSRVHAFVAFACEAAGVTVGPGSPSEEAMRRGFEFLHMLQGPDGVKTGAIEAKPWYWGAPYEVASHPFDIAAFAAEWRLFQAPRALAAMRASWRAWLGHLSPQGEPRSHLDPGVPRWRTYQCSFFWATHACWIARSLPELERALVTEAAGDDGRAIETNDAAILHSPDVDLVRIDVPGYVAWIRGRRPQGNAAHGSPVGGGLVRVASRVSGRDLFVARPFERRPEGAWSGRAGLPSLKRGLRAGRENLRFSGWVARNLWRGGQRTRAWIEPLRTARRSVLDFASHSVSSAFDRQPLLEIRGDEVRIEGQFARRDGSRVDTRVVTTFRPGAEGLVVESRVEDIGPVKRLWFRVPERAVVLDESAHHVRFVIGESNAGAT